MSIPKDRHEKRKEFLEKNRSPQKRLQFLKKYTHDLAIAIVGLVAELQPDGWKSADDLRAARNQKASITRHLRAFSDAAKELDKLHIFELAGIDQIVGKENVTRLADKVAHGSVEDINDDKLRECVDFLLEKHQWERMGMIVVCQDIQPKGWAWDREVRTGQKPIHLAGGDIIPKYPSIILAIDEEGTPHALIVPKNGRTPFSRHCDEENLAKPNPEFSEAERPQSTDFDVSFIKIGEPTFRQDNSLVTFQLEVK